MPRCLLVRSSNSSTTVNREIHTDVSWRKGETGRVTGETIKRTASRHARPRPPGSRDPAGRTPEARTTQKRASKHEAKHASMWHATASSLYIQLYTPCTFDVLWSATRGSDEPHRIGVQDRCACSAASNMACTHGESVCAHACNGMQKCGRSRRGRG